MKIFFVLSTLILLFGCKSNPHSEESSSSNKRDTTSSAQIIKGPSSLVSLQFTKNYPTHETVKKIYDAINFQRACEAYMLSFPMVVRNNAHSLPPTGLRYWEMLSKIINANKEIDKELQITEYIKPFGIERGKPFNPSLQQKVMLTDAAEIGFRMVQMTGLPHLWDSTGEYRATRWKLVPTISTSNSYHFPTTDEELATALREISLGNDAKDFKSAYMFSAEDKNGQWLDGAKYYQLHLPKNIPAKNFWSITVYDNTTWQVIHNDEPRSSFNSKQPGYLANADGSVDVFFGPIAPAGEGTNWIRTLPDRGWFAYLRLSEPTETFLDKSWPLENIEEVNEKIWKGPSPRQ